MLLYLTVRCLERGQRFRNKAQRERLKYLNEYVVPAIALVLFIVAFALGMTCAVSNLNTVYSFEGRVTDNEPVLKTVYESPTLRVSSMTVIQQLPQNSTLPPIACRVLFDTILSEAALQKFAKNTVHEIKYYHSTRNYHSECLYDPRLPVGYSAVFDAALWMIIYIICPSFALLGIDALLLARLGP
jgi:hypothetical protein